jgi:hypothetical protein
MNNYESNVSAVSKTAKSKHLVAHDRLTASKPKSGMIIVGLPQGAQQCTLEVIREHKGLFGEYTSNSQHQSSMNKMANLNSNYNSNTVKVLDTQQSTKGFESSRTEKNLKYTQSNAELLGRVYEKINYINGDDLGCLLNDL